MYKIYLLILLFSLNLFSQNQNKIDSKNYTFKNINVNNVKAGELDTIQLKKFKNYLIINYNKNLDSIKYLTISYLMPRNKCWYNNYEGIKKADLSKIEELKEKMNTEIIFSHHDKAKSNFGIWDEKKIIFDLFPKDFEACDYMITINSKGVYLYSPGHFSPEVANAFYNELRLFE